MRAAIAGVAGRGLPRTWSIRDGYEEPVRLEGQVTEAGDCWLSIGRAVSREQARHQRRVELHPRLHHLRAQVRARTRGAKQRGQLPAGAP